MSKIHKDQPPKTDFTIIANEVARSQLRDMEKIVYLYMISLPNQWVTSNSRIADILGKSTATIKRAIDGLKNNGLITEAGKKKMPYGQWEPVYRVHYHFPKDVLKKLVVNDGVIGFSPDDEWEEYPEEDYVDSVPESTPEPVSKPTTEPEPEPEQPPILDVDPIAETEEPVHQLATTEPQHNHLPAIAAHEPSNAVQRILRDSVLDTIDEPCNTPMNLKKKPSPTTRLQYTPEFEKFWKTYPRRAGGKQNTARAFEWEASQIGSYEPILAGAAQWAKVWDVSGKDMQYCPHPSTWLNQQRYEDDYEQAYAAHVQTLHDSGKSTLLQGTMPTAEARAGMKVMQDLGASPEYVNARRLDPFLDLRD